jgi:hypothetical protein
MRFLQFQKFPLSQKFGIRFSEFGSNQPTESLPQFTGQPGIKGYKSLICHVRVDLVIDNISRFIIELMLYYESVFAVHKFGKRLATAGEVWAQKSPPGRLFREGNEVGTGEKGRGEPFSGNPSLARTATIYHTATVCQGGITAKE